MIVLYLMIASTIIPNVHTSVQYGTIGPYDVMTVEMFDGGIAAVVGDDGSLSNVNRFSLGTNFPSAYILQKGDLLTSDSSYQPFVGGSGIFYVGLVYDSLSYGWVEVSYLGGKRFGQVRSAVTTSGDDLLVGETYGDFDGNGSVDGRDLLTWQRSPEWSLPLWLDMYGVSWLRSGAGSSFVVPEPRAGSLFVVLVLGSLFTRRLNVKY